MTTSYKQKLSPWQVYQLNYYGKWILLNSYRSRTDADNYAKLLRQASINPVKVVFDHEC